MNYSVFSKYRLQLFGIAAILIILYHSINMTFFNISFGVFDKVLNFTDIGVDIFIFLSAMGLYYSFKKDNNIKKFYLNRIRRVLIPTILLSSIYWILIYILKIREGIFNFTLDITTLAFYTRGDRTLWYIPFIMIMYLIYPLIFRIIEKNNKRVLVLIPISVLLSFVISNINNPYYQNIEIALGRIPIFLLGCYFSKKIFNNEEIRIQDIISLLVTAIVIFIIYKVYPYSFVKRYIYLTTSILSIELFARILEMIKNKYINKILSLCGKISLELYITHILLIRLYENVFLNKFNIVNCNGKIIYIVIIILSFIISIIFNKLMKVLNNRIDKIQKDNKKLYLERGEN